MTPQTPETESAYWDEHTRREEQYGGDWDDDACLREIEAGIGVSGRRLGPYDDPSPNGIRVLDLGCGTGRLLLPLAAKYPTLTFFGLDSSAAMVMALERAAREGEVPRNVHYQIGDGRRFPDNHDFGSFLLAYSVLLFQHLPPDAVAAYIGEVARVLKPGGRFRFQFAHGDGTDHSFLNHNHAREHVIDWVTEGAGLKLTAVEVGRVFDEWTWVTARKPEEA